MEHVNKANIFFFSINVAVICFVFTLGLFENENGKELFTVKCIPDRPVPVLMMMTFSRFARRCHYSFHFDYFFEILGFSWALYSCYSMPHRESHPTT